MPPRKKAQARKPPQHPPQTPASPDQTPAQTADVQQTRMDLHIQDYSRSDLARDLEKYPEVQRELFTALQAIYPENFERVHGKTEAWQREENLAFAVKLFPLDQTDYYLLLEIELPRDFPKVGPRLVIRELQPDGDVFLRSSIAGVVNDFSGHWKGNADDVHDTVSHIVELLGNTAQSRAAKRTQYSLEEERARTEVAAQNMARQQEENEARRRLEVRQKAQEDFQQEVSTVREQRGKQSSSATTAETVSSTDESLAAFPFDDEMIVRDLDENNEYRFKSVFEVFILLDRTDKKVTIVRPVIGARKRYPRLLKKDIFLPDTLNSNGLRAKLTEVESVLDATRKYRHPNVMEVLGYKIDHVDLGGGTGEWQLNILSEYANKGSLSEILDIATTLTPDKVKAWTVQVIQALEFFDQQGFVHPAVHLGNILLCLSRRGEITIKLADGYGTALRALVMQSQGRDPIMESAQSSWTAPELTRTGAFRSNKTCIWDLGIVILQMVFGKHLQQKYTSPHDCIDSNNLSSSFERMIQAMFESKPNARPTAFRLRGERFLKDEHDDIWAVMPSRTGIRRKSMPMNASANGSSTRWQTDWEEAEKPELGAGGFGKVLKARYKFDGQVYAVKKIQCKNERQYSELFGEVAVIAKLNHPCCVRYYGAWFEEKAETVDDDDDSHQGRHRHYRQDLSSIGRTMSRIGHDFMDDSFDRRVGPEFSEKDSFLKRNNDSILNEIDLWEPREPPKADDPLDLNQDGANEKGHGLFEYQKPGGDDSSDSPSNSPSGSQLDSRDQNRRAILARTPSRTSEGILYIQMEFCEGRSLTNKIHDGLWKNEQELWRIFRLILDGLKHIHDHRIVHRDLKPDNIFVDSAGNPKIGDFGLAAPGINPIAESESKTSYTESKGIGTKFYTAPELESSGTGAYSTKADMYSLGIVLFEMSYPMSSRSERVQTLSRLVSKDHQLPSDFLSYAKDAQANLILQLINNDQHMRPSVAELLENPTIPKHQYEMHELSKYLEKISLESPEQFINLFQQHYSKRNALSLDRTWEMSGMERSPGIDQALLVSIERKFEDVFHRHGGVKSSRLSIFPKSDYYDDAAVFIDTSGLVCQLAYDFTLPHARKIASASPPHKKTYCIGPVFRKPWSAGEEPRAIVEADFDIVSSSEENSILKEAEILKVLDEVLEAFPVMQRKTWVIYINHNELLDLVLEYCRIEPGAWSAVKSSLSQLHAGALSLVQVRDNLRTSHNVRETSLTDLAKFFLTGSVEQVQTKMKKLLQKTTYAERAEELLLHLKELTQLALRMGVSTMIEVAPLINHSQQLHHGDLMIVCLEKSSKRVIATGGRYDSLVAEFRTGSTSPRAVGLRFGLARMATFIGEEQARARCDVLVTSFDKEALTGSCIDLVKSLWAEDISAEVSDTVVSTEELLASGGASQYSMIVLARRGGIKVRNMRRGGEENEVASGELASFVKGELTGRRKRK